VILPASWAAIDPGKHMCALAGFLRDRLTFVDFVSVVSAWEDLATFDLVVAEKPQLDGRAFATNGRKGVDVRDIIDLAWSGALVVGACRAPVVAYEVREWKGSARKPQHHHAFWRALTEPERAILGGAPTLALIERACEAGARDGWSKPGADYYGRSKAARVHNLLDAAALGMFHAGRVDRDGFPRKQG
jgi:hypothetical protein